jgi:very-short-patch-repair endonuclease
MEKASSSNHYHYNPKLKVFARELRNHGTKAEACLWKYALRAGRFANYNFKRQRPVLHYIADFMCVELMLIIEADGNVHDSESAILYDAQRDKDLEAIGFTVLRFSNWEILNRMSDVKEILYAWLGEWEKKSGV